MTPALRSAAERGMQVVTQDGRIYANGRAVLFVLEMVGWHPRLMRLAARRPLVWLVDGGYRLVADHRNLFSRVFFRGRTEK
jgi:predicted DCC family thiol-disulfide oxidoreductase YuxK